MRRDNPGNDRKKLAMLGVLGFGLMMAARRRRYAFSQMRQAGPGGGPGGFGGHGPWRRGWPTPGGELPPMIDAKLRAWHERAHRQPGSGEGSGQPTGQVQV